MQDKTNFPIHFPCWPPLPTELLLQETKQQHGPGHEPSPVTWGTCPLPTLCQAKAAASLFILNCYFKIGNKGHQVNTEQLKSKVLFPRLQGSKLVWFILLPGSNSTRTLHHMTASIFIRMSALLLLLLDRGAASRSPPSSITSDFSPAARLRGERDATGAARPFLPMQRRKHKWFPLAAVQLQASPIPQAHHGQGVGLATEPAPPALPVRL